MIDPITAWEYVKQNASKALKTRMVWHSLVQGRQYRLVEVSEHFIVIQRQDNGLNQELTRNRVIRAVNDFNIQNCVVRRRHLISPTVAEETALVLFHPQLGWDDNNEYIIQTH